MFSISSEIKYESFAAKHELYADDKGQVGLLCLAAYTIGCFSALVGYCVGKVIEKEIATKNFDLRLKEIELGIEKIKASRELTT